MEYYPINLNLKGMKCLVIGGGEVALRKINTLKKTGAKITVISPKINTAITGVQKIERRFKVTDLDDYFLVIAATSNKNSNQQIADHARKNNRLVNIVDNKDLSNFILPSIVDRDPLIISISTSGIAPVLSKKIKEDLKKQYGTEYSTYLKIMRGMRGTISAIDGINKKLSIWDTLTTTPVIKDIVKSGEKSVNSIIKRIIHETK